MLISNVISKSVYLSVQPNAIAGTDFKNDGSPALLSRDSHLHQLASEIRSISWAASP